MREQDNEGNAKKQKVAKDNRKGTTPGVSDEHDLKQGKDSRNNGTTRGDGRTQKTTAAYDLNQGQQGSSPAADH